VNNWNYTVRLYFSENYYEEANRRSFDVRINNEIKLENFDVYTEANGGFKGISKRFDVTVTNGLITIATTGHLDVAFINGISVVPIVEESGNSEGCYDISSVSGEEKNILEFFNELDKDCNRTISTSDTRDFLIDGYTSEYERSMIVSDEDADG